MKLEGFCLITRDVCALAQFYDQVLRTKSDIDPVHTVISVDGAGLAIYSAEAARRDMELDCGAGKGNFSLQFSVEDVDENFAHLSILGVRFASEPRTWPWGARSFQFYDPDGNMVTFAGPAK